MFVLVVGGGKVGYYLTKELIENGHEVVLMEKDRARADQIADEIGSVVVPHDGCEGKYLAEAGANRADIVAAVTGDDEDNLVICQMAKHHFDVERSIARVNNPKNEGLFKHLGVDEIISPTRMILGSIEQDIPVHELLHLAALGEGELELIEAHLQAGSPAVGRAPKDLDIPEGCSLFAYIRNGVAAPLRSDTILLEGDKVIAIGRTECERLLHSQLIGDAEAIDAADGATDPSTIVSPEDNPLPNPSPGPGDVVPSRVVSASGALRRSLVVWGWGQLAAGDRRGWLGPPAQVAAVTGLVLAAPWAASTAASAVFVGFALVAAAWVAVAVHAWRRAAGRRAALGGRPGGGSAELLWLAPVVVVIGAGFWIAAGPGADPALALDAYLADWQAGRVEAGSARFVSPPSAVALAGAWGRQDVALRNAVVRILAAEPSAIADPSRPLHGLRWVDLGPTPDGGRSFAVEAARQETVRGAVLWILPTTSRRLVTVERLGVAELRPAVTGGGGWPFGTLLAWRVVRVEIAGAGVGSGNHGPNIGRSRDRIQRMRHARALLRDTHSRLLTTSLVGF